MRWSCARGSSSEATTEVDVAVDRQHLIAVGTSFGFVAYTRDGAVSLPHEWATLNLSQQQAMAPAVAAAINQAIGAT